MKRILFALAVIAGLAGLAYVALTAFRMNTKKYSPEAVASLSLEGWNLEVAYCQPSKKNREIFGKLVPYGVVWRTGANEATQFTSSLPLQFPEGTLPAGTYSLFSIPDEGGWTIIFNKATGKWGTQYDERDDALRVQASVSALPNPEEIFQIALEADSSGGAFLQLAWDRTAVILPLRR
jgi:hypothetical protein